MKAVIAVLIWIVSFNAVALNNGWEYLDNGKGAWKNTNLNGVEVLVTAHATPDQGVRKAITVMIFPDKREFPVGQKGSIPMEYRVDENQVFSGSAEFMQTDRGVAVSINMHPDFVEQFKKGNVLRIRVAEGDSIVVLNLRGSNQVLQVTRASVEADLRTTPAVRSDRSYFNL